MPPEEDIPIRYHIQFADDVYQTEHHAMPFTDLLAAFDVSAVDIVTTAEKLLFPGVSLVSSGLCLPGSAASIAFEKLAYFFMEDSSLSLFGHC
jgi:hypothetical protein